MVLASILLAATTAGCTFPSEHGHCWSRDRRLVIEWVMADDAVIRHLTWRDVRAGRTGVLRDFERSGEVFWSPANHHLAVTDAVGSDSSNALRWQRVDGSVRSFEDDLRRYLPKRDPIWRNHHQYFDVVRWLNASDILVRAWGYGNPGGLWIDRLYVWDPQGNVRTTSRRRPPRIPDQQEAISQARRLLERRGLGGSSYENPLYVPVRFEDGGQGVLVALGFWGPSTGYLLLMEPRGGSLKLLDLKKSNVDWGIWTVGDSTRRVDAERVRLVLHGDGDAEDIVRVTGAVHYGTFTDEDGRFQLLRVSQRRIEVLFDGAALDGVVGGPSGNGLSWNQHQYEFVDVDGDGVHEIVETISDCEGVGPHARFKCTPRGRRSVHRYNGSRFVEVK
jgi:hypothetical protein